MSLIIQAGTIIKFRGDFSFNINGYISAIGTPEDPILFQSGMPSPLEGDCESTLTNAHKSIFKYCNFSFAENGILLNNSDSVEISFSNFTRHLTDAVAISDMSYDNSSDLIINNNFISNGFRKALN